MGSSTRLPDGSNAIFIASPEHISLTELRYQYPTRTPLTLQAELRQIASAVARGYPRLQLQRLRPDALSIVGYGPSLKHTWFHVEHPCISVSGAHDFLIERGMVPDFHAQCDGRDHQVGFLQKPHSDVTYVMASVCAERVFDQLEGHKVLLWHNCHGKHVVDWIGQNDPGGMLISGGSNVGLSAIHIGGVMGFRKFRIFGFDGNFEKETWTRHAGTHYDPQQQSIIRRWADGRKWFTSPQMSNACDEFVALSDNRDLSFEVYGDCLLVSLLNERAKADSPAGSAQDLAAYTVGP